MDVQVQRGDERWTVAPQNGAWSEAWARVGTATEERGKGDPVIVTRSLHSFPFPCEWRREVEVEGIHPVEPVALRFGVVLALEGLSRAFRTAHEIWREAARIGWEMNEETRVLGEVLEVDDRRFVARQVLAALRADEGAEPRAGATIQYKSYGLAEVPLFLQAAPGAAPPAAPPGLIYAVRRDGVAVALQEDGSARALNQLPDVALVLSDPRVRTIPCHAFCPKCEWPHPDRTSCP